MQALELILALFTIILVSSVLDQVMTRLSLPLVQIAMGVVGAIIIGEPFKLTFDSELFLVLFIGPLLYDESQHVLKRALMKNAGAILSLAMLCPSSCWTRSPETFWTRSLGTFWTRSLGTFWTRSLTTFWAGP